MTLSRLPSSTTSRWYRLARSPPGFPETIPRSLRWPADTMFLTPQSCSSTAPLTLSTTPLCLGCTRAVSHTPRGAQGCIRPAFGCLLVERCLTPGLLCLICVFRCVSAKGISVLSSISKPEYTAEDIGIFAFELSAQDEAELDGLQTGRRTCPDCYTNECQACSHALADAGCPVGSLIPTSKFESVPTSASAPRAAALRHRDRRRPCGLKLECPPCPRRGRTR
jgi:hypothetical protein